MYVILILGMSFGDSEPKGPKKQIHILSYTRTHEIINRLFEPLYFHGYALDSERRVEKMRFAD